MTNPPDPKTKTPRTDKCLSQYDDFGQYRSEPRRLELLAIESSTLELENQSLTRRLEEAVNEVGALKAQLGDLGFRSAELLDDCEAKDAKLTALRTAAEGARDALEKATARLRPIYDYLSFHASVLASEVSDVREQFDTTIEALRAELENKQ